MWLDNSVSFSFMVPDSIDTVDARGYRRRRTLSGGPCRHSRSTSIRSGRIAALMGCKQTRGRMRSRGVWAALFCLVFAALSNPSSLAPDTKSPPAWAEAAPGYQFSFPRDHAAHTDSRIEWWYYTGNLGTKSGRRYGYQLTFFRIGVVRGQVNSSRWALRDLYMAHFAISDVQKQSFRSFERTKIGRASCR